MSTDNYDYENLSAKPLDPDHLYEFVMEHYDSERLAKLAAGVCMARQSSSGLGELSAVNNTDKIRDEFDGLEYDSLAAEARNWTPEVTPERAIKHLDEYGGKSSLATRSREHWEQRARTEETHTDTETDANTSDEFAERLDNYCEKHDLDYSDLTIIPNDSADLLKRIDSEMEQHDLDAEDLCVARHADVRAVKAERDRLIGTLGIDREEAESISLSSLRRLASDGQSLDSLEPAPKSGDMQSSDTTRYSDPETAEELKQRIRYIEEHSSGGELMETQRELFEEQLAGLEK